MGEGGFYRSYQLFPFLGEDLDEAILRMQRHVFLCVTSVLLVAYECDGLFPHHFEGGLLYIRHPFINNSALSFPLALKEE